MTAPRQPLTAFEHRQIPLRDRGTPHGLEQSEVNRLTEISRKRPGFCERGYEGVRLSQHCGVLSLGTRMLEILPKVEVHADAPAARTMLLDLLRAAGLVPVLQDNPALHGLHNGTLIDIFAAAFIDAVTNLVRVGLMRRYQVRISDLTVVRGRMNMVRQLGVLSNRVDVVACEFDELSADNDWNRVLKAALKAIRPWLRSAVLQRRCSELLLTFEDVEDAGIDFSTAESLIGDRQSRRYDTAIAWARWILGLLAPSIRAGSSPAPGILFDMNVVFERAVANVLRKRTRPGVRLRPQVAGVYLGRLPEEQVARSFGLEPDMVVYQDTRVAAIFDTKWKKIEANARGFLQPAIADVYQMLAYASAFRCERLALVYPWHDGLTGTKETSYELPLSGSLKPTLTVGCIDVRNSLFPVLRGQHLLASGALFR